jgi:hypothetical protein
LVESIQTLAGMNSLVATYSDVDQHDEALKVNINGAGMGEVGLCRDTF